MALGQQLGGLGIQQAGLGEMGTNLNTQDIQNLMTTGATERGVNQAGLDALRLTNLQRYTQPYQQYGFLSDIYSGTPTGVFNAYGGFGSASFTLPNCNGFGYKWISRRIRRTTGGVILNDES